MKRLTLVLSIVLLLVAGSISSVAAQGSQANERACVGIVVSEWAQEPELHPLGQNVSIEAKEFHPLGQTTIKPFARYCDIPE
jgi:hypothetical protein